MHKQNKRYRNNVQDIDIVTSMYNLIEYNNNYSKTFQNTKTDTKLYVPVVTSSTQDNAKFIHQLND